MDPLKGNGRRQKKKYCFRVQPLCKSGSPSYFVFVCPLACNGRSSGSIFFLESGYAAPGYTMPATTSMTPSIPPAPHSAGSSNAMCSSDDRDPIAEQPPMAHGWLSRTRLETLDRQPCPQHVMHQGRSCHLVS